MKCSVFGMTDVGLQRGNNEDWLGARGPGGVLDICSGVITTNNDADLFAVVCDGMGGANGGEIASKLAVEKVLAESAFSCTAGSDDDAADMLVRAIKVANTSIFDMATSDWRLHGMGTTLTAMFLVGDRAIFAQVGDSRGYVLRGDSLVQATHDQSLVQLLIDMKGITEQQARVHPQRGVLLEALGIRRDVNVVLTMIRLQQGDRLLLCTDGLTGALTDSEIGTALGGARDPQDACKTLVDLANAAGGNDNVTVVAVFTDQDPARVVTDPIVVEKRS